MGRSVMSFRMMPRIFALNIPPTDKLVLLAMNNHARDDGTNCYPSIGTLMKETSLSRRSVQTAIRRLQAAQLVIPVGKANGGRGITMQYTLTLSSEPKWRREANGNGALGAPFAIGKRAQESKNKGAIDGTETARKVHKNGASPAPESNNESEAETSGAHIGVSQLSPVKFHWKTES
jgi:Helix-turn-helix domain